MLYTRCECDYFLSSLTEQPQRGRNSACYAGFLPKLYGAKPQLFSRTSRYRFRITSLLFASVHLEINMYPLSFLVNRSKSNDPGSIAVGSTKDERQKCSQRLRLRLAIHEEARSISKRGQFHTHQIAWAHSRLFREK